MNKLKNILNKILLLFLTAALLSGSLQGAVYAEEAKELQEISEVIEVEQKSVFNLPVLEFELECSELVYAYDEASNKREDTVLLKLEEITLSDSLENVRYIIKDSEEQIKQEDFLGEEKEIELNIEDFPKGIYTIQLLSNYNDEVESQTISSEAISFSTDYEKREYPVNKEINWSGRLDTELEVTFEDIFPEVENTLLENISDRIMIDEGETESTGSISIYDAQGNPVEMSSVVAEGKYQILFSLDEPGEMFLDTAKAYLTISYEPYTYQISYILNGGTNSSQNFAGYYAGTERALENPIKKGYQFKGWYLDSKFKKKFEQIQADTTGNKKLYAKWSKETYPITYVLDGGKNNSSNPKSYQITTSTIKLKNPSKKGHTFKGWYLEETFKTQIFQISKGSVGEITLYAKWELTPYSIQYVLGSGAVNHEANPTTYTMEMPTISFETPTRKGYIFKGWYTNSEYKKKFVEILEGSTGNKKVYAKWSKEKYIINYALDGGKNNSSNPKTYYVTTSTIKLKNPSKKGYTFKGWYLEETFENPISEIPKGSVGNVTLYAEWELTDYTITYVLGDGGINADNNPETYTMLSPTITFENPSRNGSIFKGWYSDSQYKKKNTQIAEGSTGNKKIYAKWSNIKYNITYSLDEGKNNSKNPKSYYVTTSTIKLKNPTKKGYTFLGWYLDNTFETPISEITKGSYENLTLYAKWELAEYTITYVGAENEGLNLDCYSINTPTFYLKNPEKEGYTFKGWYSDSKYKNKISKISKGSTGNKKIYAKWSAHQYTIKFNGNGATSGSMKALSGCKYDKNYTLTSNKYKKLWFTFVGWNTEPDGSGITYQNKESIKNLVADNKGTVTLYAQWEMLFNKKGVDVSSWQGTINWSQVKNAGIDFAMIRILSGGVSNMEADSQFENNYKNARNAGVSVGVYRYSYALTVEQAKQEARKVLKVLNGRHLDYPIVLDMEYSSMLTNISSNAKRTDLVLAFKKIIEEAGYEFAMYANLNWVNNYLDMDRLSDVNLWLARWRPLEQGPGYTGKGKLMMWQYTSEGTVPGISGDVDLNVGY